MMVKTIIVTGFDSKYYDMGDDLIRSIKYHNELSSFDLAVLDLGLNYVQRKDLENKNIYLKTAYWNIEFPARKYFDENEPGFKAMVARPFLPEYFPEYDNIIWLDADTWVQCPDAIIEMDKMLSFYDCCAVPEIDRTYGKFTHNPSAWLAEFSSYHEAFDHEIVQNLALRPQINTGVIAMKRDCPHWALWQEYLSLGLKNGSTCRVVEQLAFNISLYTHNLNIARYPSKYNWIIGHSPPYYCITNNKLVEPSPPFDDIFILHLTCLAIDKVCNYRVIDKRGNKLYDTGKLRPEYQYWESKVHPLNKAASHLYK